jgi:ribonuclease Z
MPRMILLGVGTAVPDVDRECTHMVWDAEGGPLLIDAAGSTFARLLRAGIEPPTLRGLLLTHDHPDHIYGFPILLLQLYLVGRREPLRVYGLPETLRVARALIAGSEITDHSLPPEWIELTAGDEVPLPASYTIRTALTEHFRPCLALRFDDPITGRALTYSADTRPCDAVAALSRDSDVLIHEATTPGPHAGHTSPREAGEIAARAGARRLILVHFSPHWTMPEEKALAEARAGGFTGPVEIGREQQVIEL